MRRRDSGWRDPLLTVRHRLYGYGCPAPGMTLPMIEYDDGVPVGIVSYHRRGEVLPKGPEIFRAHEALSALYSLGGHQLPFLTAVYDERNWAMRVFPHNEAARNLVGFDTWRPMVESDFAWTLYRMRLRKLPDLTPFGVAWEDQPWLPSEPHTQLSGESWPGSLMSVRRRCYEPAVPIPFRHRIPCTDLDLAVTANTTGGLGLVVDYKAPGAKVTLGNTNMTALSGLVSRFRTGGKEQHRKVPAMLVKYAPVKLAWKFEVHCLNESAARLLTSVMRDTNAVTPTWTPGDWTYVDEQRWLKLLEYASSF